MAEGREQKPNEIVGIGHMLPEPGEPSYAGISFASLGVDGPVEEEKQEGYAGISRADAGWYISTPGDHERFMEYMQDLPSAIEDYEKQDQWVKQGVMRDYAKWKMENDCGQHPWLLASFFRVSVCKHKFYKQLCNAITGRYGG